MKYLFQWLTKKKSERADEIDLDDIAPLIQMVEPADPDQDLFTRIERSIDADMASVPTRKRGRVVTPKIVIATFLAGLVLGLSCTSLLQSRQRVVTQTGLESPWIPLGAVTLHGSALRGFVRAKCEGQTHFFITMHGFHSEKNRKQDIDAPLLMEKEEKIRMECIF
ncbi:hypothetical protein [Sulfitobacter sp. JB4-11]|uniref:hypothetical protein n=1 Tax=Sulfitobacter rhodophyticola TaxID=3238304 RepID=UPI0035194185